MAGRTECKGCLDCRPGERLAIAKDRRTRFLRPDPGLTDRDYLIHVFTEIAKLPGVSGLFDRKHNPLYSLQPTAHGAARIVEFFQKVDTDSNTLIHDFSDPAHATRFLGDLYQHLSESARKRYALCQTPAFVVDFILNRTLTPALDAFGLETVRMIDPSCGSGHFLLATFARLFREWQRKEPGTNLPALVQRSLDAVYGVDLNPFAVEISRFRLLVAALESTKIGRLKDAPHFRFNLAAGDSLLHGSRIGGGGIARDLFKDRLQHFYDTEDAQELKRILGQTYHVVVGNPPYINVKDSVLREAYRIRFSTCDGKYQLGVPFTERMFDLTLRPEDGSEASAGWVGMIVSNAFMKRSFGKQLIEEYLRNQDLTHVIDTSGVYLPGFGTPTAIVLARGRAPVSTVIRVVRGIRGETGVPEDPALAPVWLEISKHIESPGFEGKHVTVLDVQRSEMESHPWPIGGGGAAELAEALEERAANRLAQIADDIGWLGMTHAEEIMSLPRGVFVRWGIPKGWYLPLLAGDAVREWTPNLLGEEVFFPYSSELLDLKKTPAVEVRLWPFRTTLGNRATFGQGTYFGEGRPWWSWHQTSLARLHKGPRILYGEIATHNHFVLCETVAASNQTSPIVMLGASAQRRHYFQLLSLLNSSVACFWLKQMSFPKGGDHVGTEGARVTKILWQERYSFDVTRIKAFPVVRDAAPVSLAECIQSESERRASLLPESLGTDAITSRASLNKSRDEAANALSRMIAWQEELDWKCYKVYGIIDEDLTLNTRDVPLLHAGERAFEFILARKGERLWFERHRSSPMTELPAHWPPEYKKLVERRIAVIQSNDDIALIERPEHKRRWNLPTWEEMEQAALKRWLLERIEQNSIWKSHTLTSCAQLRDVLARDADWLSGAEVYHGGPIEALDSFVIGLATPESVPYLPIMRYTESGLRKRSEWETVWELQRREDSGEKVEIPVPPKYIPKDMQRNDYWRLRGGLDVPKERFIIYPFFQRDSDASPVLGWAGWSYLDQARALASYYQRMRTEEGWEPERLKPILAGLLDLKPWLLQWHNELDPEMGERIGEYFVRYTESQCQELGFSPEEVLAWQPPARGEVRRGRKKTS